MAAVDVAALTITYGKVTAVDDLSFSAEAGEVTCVLGPNGAGKTSTVEALEGLRRPTSGRLSVIGLDPHADHRVLAERMGVMLQEGGIHPAVRVRQALRHAAALYRDPLDPGELIERLGLSGLERRTYRQLSGGEQRRLALALALVGRPQVAFLDEPTSGVDPAGRQVIRQVVADLRNDGVTVVLTTHDLDEAERVADRVIIVVGGRLIAEGTVDELTRSTGADAQVRFRAPAGLDREDLSARLGGAAVVEVAPGDYTVASPPTPQTVAALTAWLAEHDLPLSDLRAGRQRLEDVYLRLTADAEPSGPGSPRGRPRRRGRRTGAPPEAGPGRSAEEEARRGDDAAAGGDHGAARDGWPAGERTDDPGDDDTAAPGHDTDPLGFARSDPTRSDFGLATDQPPAGRGHTDDFGLDTPRAHRSRTDDFGLATDQPPAGRGHADDFGLSPDDRPARDQVGDFGIVRHDRPTPGPGTDDLGIVHRDRPTPEPGTDDFGIARDDPSARGRRPGASGRAGDDAPGSGAGREVTGPRQVWPPDDPGPGDDEIGTPDDAGGPALGSDADDRPATPGEPAADPPTRRSRWRRSRGDDSMAAAFSAFWRKGDDDEVPDWTAAPAADEEDRP